GVSVEGGVTDTGAASGPLPMLTGGVTDDDPPPASGGAVTGFAGGATAPAAQPARNTEMESRTRDPYDMGVTPRVQRRPHRKRNLCSPTSAYCPGRPKRVAFFSANRASRWRGDRPDGATGVDCACAHARIRRRGRDRRGGGGLRRGRG